MSYSITPLLMPYANRHSLHQISFQIIVARVKIYEPSGIKVKKEHWRNGIITGHPNKEKMNTIISKKKLSIEGKLLDALQNKSKFTVPELKEIITGKAVVSKKFDAFTFSLIDSLKGKLSEGRLEHYRVMINKVLRFRPNASVSDINAHWLQQFENWLRSTGVTENTVNSNIRTLKGIVRKGEREPDFRGYKNPKYTVPISEYLTEDELNKLFELVRVIEQPSHKLAGYYFLLSSYTGYRLSDAMNFNYSMMVQGDNILIRAKKNKKLVSIPVYPELAEVLEFIKDKPLKLSEQKIREYVKHLCSLAGIKKHVQFKTSRHTAATRFLQKGFTLKEVSEIIGDTPLVTEVYAHIDNAHLKKRFKELMG